MKVCNLFSKLIAKRSNVLFGEIIGYDHIKRLFKPGPAKTWARAAVKQPIVGETLISTYKPPILIGGS